MRGGGLPSLLKSIGFPWPLPMMLWIEEGGRRSRNYRREQPSTMLGLGGHVVCFARKPDAAGGRTGGFSNKCHREVAPGPSCPLPISSRCNRTIDSKVALG